MISRIKPPLIDVVTPAGELYRLNEYEFLQLRVNIKKSSYSAVWSWTPDEGNTLFPIGKDGKLKYWPPQFDLMQNLLFDLL